MNQEPSREKRTVAPEDLTDIRALGEIRISPDGNYVAFVVAEPADPKHPEKERVSNIWVAPADGSEPARKWTAGSRTDSMPRWSPDGRSLAFISNRGESEDDDVGGTRQIYSLGLEGGEAERLTAMKGGVSSFEWSPDGSMIAFLYKDPPSEEEEKKQQERDDAVHVDHDYKYTRLWVLTVGERKIEQVARQDISIGSFSWSPDGREFACIVYPTPRMDDMIWHGSLVIIRRLTGEIVRTLSEQIASHIEWSPDGKTIAFQEWSPQRISSEMVLIPAEGGPTHPLAGGYRGTIRQARWEPDSRYLLAEGIEGTGSCFLRIDSQTGEAERVHEYLSPGPNYSAGTESRFIGYAGQSEDSPDNVWFLPPGQPPRRLTDLNPQVASLCLGRMQEITWQNRTDGQTLYGVLFTPPDYKPGQPYPTVVQAHGGPQWAWWSGWHGSWHNWGQWLASHGYAVFLPNPRGSTGQGNRFAEANRDDWGGMDFQDIMDGLDTLIDRKIADPDRLGVGGWSYGGFMTAWTVTHTDRFRAAVVGAAVTNLFSFNGTTDITPSFLKAYFLDLPTARREAYESHSPTTYLANCQTPCLVLHGQADERVPIGQGWEFYNGLKAQGVETEMVVYPREGHGIEERAHQIDLLERVLEWFDRHLKA